MPKVNLFHELQRVEFERKFDPVRISIYAFILGLLVLAIWSVVLYQGYKPSREMVEALKNELKQNAQKNKEAESKLNELPQYQQEFALLKRRAENKSLKSKDIEVFKNCMPANLFVKKLSINRRVETKKEEGPRDKKGAPTFVIKTTSFNILSFEAAYTEPTKPKSLEARDKLIESLKQSEALGEIAAQVAEDSTNENKLNVVNFATTEPTGNEPSMATITVEVELKK